MLSAACCPDRNPWCEQKPVSDLTQLRPCWMSPFNHFQLICTSFITLHAWKPQRHLMFVFYAMKVCGRHTRLSPRGLSTEADLMKAGLSRPLTFRYGGRTIGNVIGVLRLNQRVWLCSSIHHRRAPVSSCRRKWGSPWRPPMSYLRLITHSAFCPLRACTHK